MAYRPTERTEARKADVRDRILSAARQLIAEHGFNATQVSQVAALAGIANGTVYRYFPAKVDLFAEVFRLVSQHEVDVMAEVAQADGSARERMLQALRVFVLRAIQARGQIGRASCRERVYQRRVCAAARDGDGGMSGGGSGRSAGRAAGTGRQAGG